MTIVYHRRDGTIVRRDPVVLTRKRYVVPRYLDPEFVPTPVEPEPEPEPTG